MPALSKPPKLEGGISVLRALFPADIAVAEVWDLAGAYPLYGAEEVYAADVHPKRRREFTAGRHCARMALAALGYEAHAIGRDIKGAPEWPSAVTGSITHTEDYAAAIAAPQSQYAGIGVDAADIGRMTPRLWRPIMTEDETAWLRAQPECDQATYATVIFSAKEAFYKCQYAITGAWLGFKAITVGIADENALSLRYVAVPAAVESLPVPQCRYRIDGGKVLTGVTISQPGSSKISAQPPGGAFSARAT